MLERYQSKIIIDDKGTEMDVGFAKTIPPENIIALPGKKEITVDWRRNFERMREIGEAWKEIYPYQDEVTINLDALAEYPTKPYLIWWMSDAHIGNVDTQYETLKRHVELIENTPNTGIVTLGDDIDNAILGKYEVRFMQAFPPYMQAFTIEDLMAELNGRNPRGKQLILAHCIGNHTHTLMEQSGYLFEKFYEKSKAGILPGIGEAFINYGSQKYEVALAHRYTGTSKLNPTLACKRLMEYAYPNADIAVVGHSHVKAEEQFFKGGKWHTAVRPGTYRIGTGLFEKARGWSYGQIGGSCSMIYPDTLEVKHYNEIDRAVSDLKRELG